ASWSLVRSLSFCDQAHRNPVQHVGNGRDATPMDEIRGERHAQAQRPRVLFLCTHNSARSQMAEGLLRHLSGGSVEAFSAGTEATRVRPLAIRAMAEVGIDISGQESKSLARYVDEPFDAVITVCDDANEACPMFP